MRKVLSTCMILILGFTTPFCATSGAGPFIWGFAIDGYPVTGERLREVESSTGLRPDLVVFFLQWPSPDESSSGDFPLASVEAIDAAGALPCITWEPMYVRGKSETAVPYSDILDGRYDAYIKRFADRARAWGKPVLVRFGHEMNLKRYHWGTTEDAYGPDSPALYRKMHRYIVDIFRRSGARNVLWAFCPNAESVPDRTYDPSALWNVFSAYYPGDDYVDVLGLDGYNWGTTRKKDSHGWDSRWRSFPDIFGSPVRELKQVSASSGRKPLIVFETSSAPLGGNKMEWIERALSSSERLGISGIVWFESDKEIDWRIGTGTGGLHAPLVKNKQSDGKQGIEMLLKDVAP